MNSDSTVTRDKDGDDDSDMTDYSNVTLPYTTSKSADWVRGDGSNVAVAMSALRAYEMNDMNALASTLADSVEIFDDNYYFKGTRDSIVGALTKMRKGIDSVFIRMEDYESVKSKSRGDQWVSLWYVQTSKSKGGKTDSSMVMDDIKIVNGKVAIVDTKGRRLPKKS